MYDIKPALYDDKPDLYDDMTDLYDDMTDLYDDMTDLYAYPWHVWYQVIGGELVRVSRFVWSKQCFHAFI